MSTLLIGTTRSGCYDDAVAGRTTYKAVFMDFYGTVAAGDVDAVERVCNRLVAEQGLKISGHELALSWGKRFFEAIDACAHNGFQTLYQCECNSLVDTCEPLCGFIDPKPYVDEFTEYMRAPQLQPEAVDVLASIDLPVCCVSNADTDDLSSAIAHHQLPFDQVVCSEDVRSYKPEAPIFERALEVMGLPADQVLHIGDSLHSDIAGARRAGITAVWVCRDRRIYDAGDGSADHKVSCLLGLRDILT